MNISPAVKTKLLLKFYHCYKITLHLHLVQYNVYACCASVHWFCSHHFLWISLKRLPLRCECFLCMLLFQKIWGLGQWL